MLRKNRFERIVNSVASVYAPMFLRVYLMPRAFDCPENAIKKCFLKYVTAWLNPTNVAVRVFLQYRTCRPISRLGEEAKPIV